MLELRDLTVHAGGAGAGEDGEEAPELLHKIKLQLPASHFCAVVGPSGCGKSTLLKAVAGLIDNSDGSVWWSGRDLEEDGDLEPWEVGYVPQFSIAYEHLTVFENLDYALRLRVGGLSGSDRDERIDKILEAVGLVEQADRQVRILSGGQRRRLALALELLSSPSLMLCDEVTSGLDPKSEKEVVRLMHALSREEGRVVISVTHSLAHFELYDSVVILFEGKLVFHGPPTLALHYFDIPDFEHLFPRLAKRTGEEWHASWGKKREAYYAEMMPKQETAPGLKKPEPLRKAAPKKKAPEPDEDDDDDEKYRPKKRKRSDEDDLDDEVDDEEEDENEEKSARGYDLPGPVSQTWTLLMRRFRIFSRDRSQMGLQALLIVLFPLVVAIFAYDGLPQIQNLPMGPDRNPLTEAQDAVAYSAQAPKIGMLVSGLIMFQVILLALMASNNGAREIAGERPIFEKEKLAGLNPGAYIAGKAIFTAFLVVAQSAWMAFFVNWIVRFEGDFEGRMWQLLMVNGAITATCLAISSFSRSPEQASLLSLYVVGFQLPLSGAMLALPTPLDAFVRPFISAYWGWSGSLQTMVDTRFYDVVLEITQTPLAGFSQSLVVLGAHIVLGIAAAWVGSRNSRWE